MVSVAEPAQWFHVADVVFDDISVGVPGDETFVFERPWWHSEAACRGQMSRGRSLWYSNDLLDIAAARAVCAGCTVQVLCCDAGENERWGVWG